MIDFYQRQSPKWAATRNGGPLLAGHAKVTFADLGEEDTVYFKVDGVHPDTFKTWVAAEYGYLRHEVTFARTGANS